MTIDLTNVRPQREHYDESEKREIIARLKERARQWVPELFPSGKFSKDRKEWCLANIGGLAPRKDGSCKIALTGDEAGCWYDFSEADGDGPIATIRDALQLYDDDLWDKAAEYANVPLRQPTGRAARNTKKDRTADVQFILNQCAPAAGTLAERYLSARGLVLPATATDVLFHSSLTDWEAKIGRPAMVAVVRQPHTGAPTGGIHRTYLSDDGAAKADMAKPKMMLGDCHGVVMLMPMSPDGTLGIGEGLESSLAAVQIFFLPVWAALSTSGLVKFEFPPGLRRLVIFADRGDDGENAAVKLRTRAITAGIETKIVLPISDDDFNTDLQHGYTKYDYETPNGESHQEIISPPSSFDDIAASAQTLTRPPDEQHLTQILRGIAMAQLDPMQRDHILAIIKAQAGIGKVAATEYLKTARREVGLLTTNLPAGAPTWFGKLQMFGETGEPKQCLYNTLVALRHHEDLQGVFAYDEFAAGPCMIRRSSYDIGDAKFPRALEDGDRLRLTEYVQSFGLNSSKEIASQAVQVVAEENRFHPVREWFDTLSWDGVSRLDTWLIDYAGAVDTIYTRAIAARFLISAVARVYRPGCKVDCALILEGKQGIGKSKLLRLLFDGDDLRWFTDEIADLGSKDSAMQLRGVWCVELAELDALNRTDIARLKAFMSRTNDRYRPPFGYSVIDVPRQCVFAGTVNDSGYLRDPTGGRRFWPVKCSDTVNALEILPMRNQLWAEALARFLAGEKFYLHEKEIVDMANEQQDDRIEDDAWDNRIAAFLNKRFPRQKHTVTDQITPGEILEEAIGMEIGKWGRSEQTRVVKHLLRNGWERTRLTLPDGTKPYAYKRIRLGKMVA